VGLLALSVSVGLAVVHELTEAEVTDLVGPKGKWNAERSASRHGHETEPMMLSGRRVQLSGPRARLVDGKEMELASY
jgi:hypothetical protein